MAILKKYDTQYLCDGTHLVTEDGLLPIEYVFRKMEIANEASYYYRKDLAHNRKLVASHTIEDWDMYAIVDPQAPKDVEKITKHKIYWSSNTDEVKSEQELYIYFQRSILYQRYGIHAFVVWCNEMGYDPLYIITDDVQFECIENIKTMDKCTITKGAKIILRATNNAHIVEVCVLEKDGYTKKVTTKQLMDKILIVK